MTDLYTKDNNGNIRVWSIEPEIDGFVITHGVLGGSLQTKFEEVLFGKVNRSQDEQIELQMNARISKQRDKGYVDTIEQAMARKPTNQLGLLKPMLAKSIEDVEIDYSSAFVQRKYDGNRCLITNTNGNIIAYSRNGKPINSIDHILCNLDLQEGETIDGELYCHGQTLQTIVSWIKRQQPESKRIKFNVYDYVSDKPFSERLKEIQRFDVDGVNIAETYHVSDLSEVMDLFKLFRNDGYEGAIVRHGLSGYQDGKRSKSLLKVKEWMDMEFMVYDIDVSKDGWAILNCKTLSGKTFNVTCHGDHSYKEYVWLHRDLFIGHYVTVEFAYFTADGIPFHPIAKGWR